MAYGPTLTGFNPKPFDVILAELKAACEAAFGPILDTPGSVFGELLATEANALNEQWLAQQAVYLSQYRRSAEGWSLDGACELCPGIERLPATRTVALCWAVGRRGVTIQVDKQVSNPDTHDVFLVTAETVLTLDEVFAVTLRVLSEVDNTAYTVGINGTPVTINSGAYPLLRFAGEFVTGNTIGLTVNGTPITPVDFDTYGNQNDTMDGLAAAIQALGAVETAVRNPDNNLEILIQGAAEVSIVLTAISVTGGATTTTGVEVPADQFRIAEALTAKINAASLPVVAQEGTGVDAGRVNIETTDLDETFALTIADDNLLIADDVYGPLPVRAELYGAIPALPETITQIDTPVAGWDSVTNIREGTTGQDAETNIAFRARAEESLSIAGGGTLASMVAHIRQDLPDLETVRGYENVEDTTVDGMPPHSIEIVVEGDASLDQAVGDDVFAYKPGGVQTTGNTDVQVLDQNGDYQTVYFSHPALQYLWVTVDVTAANPDQALPADAITQITDAILAYGATLEAGDNIVFQRIVSAAFSIAGVYTATINAQLGPETGPFTPSGTANISIGRVERASFDADRIAVMIP